MKKIYFAVLLAALVSGLQSQSTFVIKNQQGVSTLTNNTVFYHSVEASSSFVHNLLFINTSAATQTYTIRKTEVSINTVGAGDKASAYFCTGLNCYTGSSASFSLAAGDTMDVTLDLDEATVKGLSVADYKFADANNTTDNLVLSERYNDPSSPYLSVSERSLFSNVSGVYPNPSKNGSSITVNSKSSADVSLSVINALGDVVYTKPVSLSAGSNVISTGSETLSAGVYFVTISGANTSISRKFVVLK